ncbi:C40 family peptidase [Niveispirillum sp. KHB5.9]|uniref:C40 family peptidase n=1 Tax=Niveispirillum sp. KHB5.9 TaxID=3400269 RepID=UPI003A844CF7
MTDQAKPDPRIHPYRDDLAASYLRGRVQAARFIDGVPCQVRSGFVALKEEPSFEARQSTELLLGEGFTVLDEHDGWAWGQNETDGYVGWLRVEALEADLTEATHKVTALRTFLQPEADLKLPFLDVLPMGASVVVTGEQGDWRQVEGGGWLHARHLAPVDAHAADFVAVAERFVGTPYLWGGRTSIGIDCSGLVQVALLAAGAECLRDSDQQAALLGTLISADGTGVEYRRGDLVFFPGHVGIMTDATTLLHANAFHMQVVAEPLADVLARAGAKGINAVKRLG